MQTAGKLTSTVTWEVREGQVEAAKDIIARFVPLARAEPGMELLTVNQDRANPRQFLFYEIYASEAAFQEHQETPYFRTMILEQAIPLLSQRARVNYTSLS